MSDGTSGMSSKEQQNPFAPKDAEVCTPEPQGRLGEAWPITIPEQVVGSVHEFEVPTPKNLSHTPAIGIATVSGSPDMSVDWGIPTIMPGMGSGPLKIKYSPTSAGPKHATLTLVMKWEDGHVENRTIQVTASARQLDDVPQAEAGSGPAPSKTSKPPVESKAPDRAITVDGVLNWKEVDKSWDGLIKEQKQGITDVATQADKFKPKPAPRSIWEDLAELAFSIGTGAIGGLVAKFVASKVAGFLVNAKEFTKVAEEGEKDIAAAEKAASAAKGDVVEERMAHDNVIAKKVGNFAKEDAARHREGAQDQLGEGLGGAFEKIIDKGAEEARGETSEKDPDNHTDGEGGDDVEAAPDDKAKDIAFFSDQQSKVNALDKSGNNRLDSIIAETLKAHPDIATDVMQGIVAGLDAATAEAKKKQTLATSAEFMTYLARTNLGTKEIKTAHGSQTVTDMTEQRARGHSKLEASSLATGVLEIDCDYVRGQEPRVTDARAENVSYVIVNQLLNQPLAHSGVPIRVKLWGSTIITRDEAGRLRVSGLLDFSGPTNEEQSIQEAERIMHIIFSKTLKGWGIAQIHTNDDGQRADPKKKESEKA